MASASGSSTATVLLPGSSSSTATVTVRRESLRRESIMRRESLQYQFQIQGQPFGAVNFEPRSKQQDADRGERATNTKRSGRSKAKEPAHSTWGYLYDRVWDTLRGAFKKEQKLNEIDIFNEACALRLQAHYAGTKGRSRRELELLIKKTSFTKNELKLLYSGWKCSCPSGALTESTFKDIYAQFFPQAGDSTLYAHYVYKAMFAEKAKEGEVSFTDYATALSHLCRGTTIDKLEWTFRLYDINGDGKLTIDEIEEISRAIYGLLGFYVAPSHDEATCEEHAERVFKKLDKFEQGFVTLEQFLEVCLHDANIVESMQLLDTQCLD